MVVTGRGASKRRARKCDSPQLACRIVSPSRSSPQACLGCGPLVCPLTGRVLLAASPPPITSPPTIFIPRLDLCRLPTINLWCWRRFVLSWEGQRGPDTAHLACLLACLLACSIARPCFPLQYGVAVQYQEKRLHSMPLPCNWCASRPLPSHPIPSHPLHSSHSVFGRPAPRYTHMQVSS